MDLETINKLHEILTTNNDDNIINTLQKGRIILTNDAHDIMPKIIPNLIFFKKGGQCNLYRIKNIDNIIVKEWIVPANLMPLNNKNELKAPNCMSEPLINVVIKKIINNNICVNFAETYKTIMDYKSMKIFLFMESCDGEFIEFEKIMGRKMSVDDYINSLIQIFYALYTLKLNNIIHSDIHFGNILIKKINSVRYPEITQNITKINGIDTKNIEAFSYVIDEETFILPNLGFIIKICDFGTSQIAIRQDFWMVPINGKLCCAFNYDLLTIFLSIIDVSNRISYNIRKKYSNLYCDDIIIINDDIINKCVTVKISDISRGEYRPYVNMTNTVISIVEICKHVYSKGNFNNNYSSIIEFRNK